MTDYLTHTACGIEKISKRALAGHMDAEDMVQQHIVQLKFDGICGIMRVSGDYIDFFTRTGEPVTSMVHVADAFRALPYDMLKGLSDRGGDVDHVWPTEHHRDGVYIGEFWHPTFKQSTINGATMCHEPKESSREIQFVVCDFLTPDEWLSGHSPVGFLDRIERIAWMQAIYHPDEGGEFQGGEKPKAPPVWFCGHEGTVSDQAAVTVNDLAKEACDAGNYDGIILRKPDGTWTRGARDENIIKVKPSLTLDLRVTGIEEGKGKHLGKVGALIVDYKGKPCRVGTGLSDKQREDWHDDPHQTSCGNYIIGRIVEVQAMSESTNGLLREPRLKGLRFDTKPEDEK